MHFSLSMKNRRKQNFVKKISSSLENLLFIWNDLSMKCHIYECSKRLLHKNFSNMYLSRYNSDSLDYQCQHTATIPWTINATTMLGPISLAIGVNTDTSNQLIKTKLKATISIHMFQRNQITLITVIKVEFQYKLRYIS